MYNHLLKISALVQLYRQQFGNMVECNADPYTLLSHVDFVPFHLLLLPLHPPPHISLLLCHFAVVLSSKCRSCLATPAHVCRQLKVQLFCGLLGRSGLSGLWLLGSCSWSFASGILFRSTHAVTTTAVFTHVFTHVFTRRT